MNERSGNRFRQFGEEIRNVDKKRMTAEEAAAKLNLKFHGSGRECAVVSLPDSNEKVFGATFKPLSQMQARKILHTQRILSTLFPHNFPKFYGVASAPVGREDEHISGTIRQLVEGLQRGKDYESSGEPTNLWSKLAAFVRLAFGKQPSIRYPFADAEKTLGKLGLHVVLDSFDANFILSKDGGEYFVDTPKPLFMEDWDEEKVSGYMEKRGIEDTDNRKVRESIAKLKEIALEEQRQNAPQKRAA